MPTPAVIFPPQSLLQLKSGFDQLADLLALTLGPTQGVILSAQELKPRPEILTDAATIARRITALPDREQNVGVMLLRNLVWRMHERVGDGGALTAVLAQAILDGAGRGVAAGRSSVLTAEGIRMGAKVAVDALKSLSRPARGEAELAAVAMAVTGEEQLSWVLGEMFDLLGERAWISIEDYVAPYLERVYLDGGQWSGSLASPYFITAQAARSAVLQDARVALYDGVVASAEEVRPLFELLAGQEPIQPVLLVAHRFADAAVTQLTAIHQSTPLKLAAVNLTRAGEKASSDLTDLADLSGAKVLSPAIGRTLVHITLADLGRARRVEAGAELMLVSGGGGDQGQIRDRIEQLEAQLQRVPIGEDGRTELEARLGRLSGSVGVLKIGAISQAERDYLHARASQGIKTVQAALEEGVVPGGGSAYLHCIPAVLQRIDEQNESSDSDLVFGMRVVARALEAPFNRILCNAGVDAPALWREEIRRCPPGALYDCVQMKLADANQSGILDSSKVLRAALETATSGAVMALSADTIVLKRNPRVSYEP